MEVSNKRKDAARNGVVAGSVWETRMKSDEVKGGFRVFNGDDHLEENGRDGGDEKKSRPKQTSVAAAVASSSVRRRTWKSENAHEKTGVQIPRRRSEGKKNLDDQSRELSSSVSVDGIKKSPAQAKKTRSVDGAERSPVQKMKTRSEESKESIVSSSPIQIRKSKSESCKEVGESSDGAETSSIPLRKVKSESIGALIESGDENGGDSIVLSKAKSVPIEIPEESGEITDNLDDGIENSEEKLGASEEIDGSTEKIEKNLIAIKVFGSDENCKEMDKCQEKVNSSSLSNVGQVKSAPQLVSTDDDDDDDDDDWNDDDDEELDEEIEIEIEKKKKKSNSGSKEIKSPEEHPKQGLNVVKKIHQVQEKLSPITPFVKQQNPLFENKSRVHSSPTKTIPTPIPNNFQRMPESHGKMQSLVDLVMWRDVSRSAFVFGTGSFVIISSSYTKDLNISLISVVSYLSLVYLALIYLYRSIICRGIMDIDDKGKGYVVGEEEAVWLLKLVLPYLNEFLLKLRALFSGDPTTTMKLAVLLFVLARCGSSITIWKMAKLGFFGAFTVPKVCASYSPQLSAYGKFWIHRFRDAWETCSHKKAVAFGIFTLVWNLSSIVARIWAVFMLFVAFRYYQQSFVGGEDWVDEQGRGQDTWQAGIGGRRQGRGTTSVGMKKTKKAF